MLPNERNINFKTNFFVSLLHWIRRSFVCSEPFLLPVLFRRLTTTSTSGWPDWAIYFTCGNFSKPFATINLPKSLTFLGNFCKSVKIFHFSSEIIFGHLFIDIWQFLLVTLVDVDDDNSSLASPICIHHSYSKNELTR